MIIKNIIKSFFIKSKYKNFNKKFFKGKKNNQEILVEFNAFYSTHLFLAIISSVLSEKFGGKIVGYFNNSLTCFFVKKFLITMYPFSFN